MMRRKSGVVAGSAKAPEVDAVELRKIRHEAILPVGAGLEDDAKREVERAAGADERAGQLEVGARVDEQPTVIRAEAEEAELVETPAGDALILHGQLVDRMCWELGWGHTCSNDEIRAEFVGSS